jgi:hypothetical protein
LPDVVWRSSGEFVASRENRFQYSSLSLVVIHRMRRDCALACAFVAPEAVVPDFDQARDTLREAIADCGKISLWIDQRNFYNGYRQPIESDAAALATPDRGTALEDDVENIQDKLDEAKDAADNHDFDEAQARLTEAKTFSCRAKEMPSCTTILWR